MVRAVMRMREQRTPKVTCKMGMGNKRKRGCSKRACNNEIAAILRKRKLNWKQPIKGRKGWRRIIALTLQVKEAKG